MTPNLALVQRFIEAMNAHDADAMAACYAPDARVIYPRRPPQGPKEHAEGERAMLAAVPDYQIEPLSLLEAEGGHVVLELHMRGTQREDLGGRSFEITGAYIFRIENGLIAEERAYPDLAGLRRQLNPR